MKGQKRHSVINKSLVVMALLNSAYYFQSEQGSVNAARVQLDSMILNGQKQQITQQSSSVLKNKIRGQTQSLNLAQITEGIDESQSVDAEVDVQALEAGVPDDQAATQTEDAQAATPEQPAAEEAAPADGAAAQTAEAEATPEQLAQAQAQAEAQVQAQAQPEAPAAEEAPVEAPKKAPKKKIAIKKKAAAKKAPKVEEESPAAEPGNAETAPADGAAAQTEEMSGLTAEQQAQVQAEAEAQAQAQQEAEQQQTAQAQPQAAGMPNFGALADLQSGLKAAKTKKVVNTKEANEAAALAAAAEQALAPEKPWNKMTAAEKEAKKEKDAQLAQEKKEKEERENPTVDENGEHIMTVAEAKEQAADLQNTLIAGEAAVEEKIRLDQEKMMNEPVNTEPVKQEEDDGHLETVEEAKAKMAAAQKAMDEGIANTDKRQEQMQQEQANMPNFGALADLHSSLSGMSNSRKKKQVNDLAAKLGIDVMEGDYQLGAEEMSSAFMARAKEAGKSDAEINAAFAE